MSSTESTEGTEVSVYSVYSGDAHPTMSYVSRTFLYLYTWKVRGVGLDTES
mgnify:FL=1